MAVDRRPVWWMKHKDSKWTEVGPERALELEGAYEMWQHEQAAEIIEHN